MADVRDAIAGIVEAEKPTTCRSVFYRCVSAGVVSKTEQEYKGTVCRLLAEMRREGRIDYSSIVDNTRLQRKPTTYSDLDHALRSMQNFYRRDLWEDQDAYVEIWSEKDAISGLLADVTEEWDVPLMISRGFSSISFLHSAAEAIAYQGKPAFLYHFGDHDPAGVHIDKDIEAKLRKMAPGIDIRFERIAVLPWQIEEYRLPTRPTKTGGTHSRGFKGESVEVDAIEPDTIRSLCRDCIVRHVNKDDLQRTRLAERAERETLDEMIRRQTFALRGGS